MSISQREIWAQVLTVLELCRQHPAIQEQIGKALEVKQSAVAKIESRMHEENIAEHTKNRKNGKRELQSSDNGRQILAHLEAALDEILGPEAKHRKSRTRSAPSPDELPALVADGPARVRPDRVVMVRRPSASTST